MTIGPGIPGGVMEAFAEGFACGQVGILTVTIDDGDGGNVLPQTTANIVEIECGDDGFAVYRYLGVYPSPASDTPYLITWEGASASDPLVDTTASEEIEVSTEAPAVPSGAGPCTDWITEDDIVACCNVDASSGVIFSDVIGPAQSILYELAGRRFAGLCGPVTVRPCRDNCSCFPAQDLAYASGGSRLIWTGDFWGWGGSSYRNCGCGCLSQVKLAGYPVAGINQVKIDGEVVAPSDYRLDKKRFLTRKNGGHWPSCQDLSLDDDEEGTFSVSYWYGEAPPALGVLAAAQLACEMYKECTTGVCALPRGTTRITRQGITIERLSFTTWGLREGVWRTGLPMVDAFLSAYNPKGILRRPTVWSASASERYAQRVGP